MTYKSKYDLFSFVYVIHDAEQTRWMITSVEFTPSPIYHLCAGPLQMDAYEQELMEIANVTSYN